MLLKTPFPRPPIQFRDVLAHLRNSISEETLVQELSNHWGQRNFVLAKSARQAIWMILQSLPHEDRDEVIISSFMCPVVPIAVMKAGFKPVFADIIPDGFTLSIDDVKQKINPKTIAIILPYSFGCYSEIDEFKNLCAKHDIILIEDCSQTIDAKYKGKYLGFNADFGVWSFGIGKNIASLNGAAFWFHDKHRDRVQKFIDEFYSSSYITKNWHDIFRAAGIPVINSKIGYSLLSGIIALYQNRREMIRTYNFNTQEFDTLLNKLEVTLIYQQLLRYENIYKLKKNNYSIYENELNDLVKFPNPVDDFEPDFLYAPILLDKQLRDKMLKKYRENIVNDINFSYLDKKAPFKKFTFETPNRLKVQDRYLLLSLHHNEKETIYRAKKIRQFILENK